MTFYQLLFSKNINGVNRNLTWYWNLFAKYMRENVWKLLAKILKIKGNTVVWNQLIQNGDFSDGTTGWNGNGATLSISNGHLLITTTRTGSRGVTYYPPNNIPSNHKVLFRAIFKRSASTSTIALVYLEKAGGGYDSSNRLYSTTNTIDFSAIITTTDSIVRILFYPMADGDTGDTIEVSSIELIDLTLLNDSRITDYASFSQYYPLLYYSYDSGSLLSFNGTGIKTTGKNLINSAEIEQGSFDTATGQTYATSTRVRTPFIEVFEGNYTVSSGNGYDVVFYVYDMEKNFAKSSSQINWQTSPYVFTMPFHGYIRLAFRKSNNSDIVPSEITSEQMEFGSTATAYEPYQSSTLDIPISTYFPTGMKSAGSVYDELTPTKAIQRIGEKNLGGLTWERAQDSGGNYYFRAPVNLIPNLLNMACAIYQVVVGSQVSSGDKRIGVNGGGSYLYVRDDSYTDATTFKTAMSGIYLYYELATPTEVSIEPPLNLSYEIEWGGTEQLLPENTSTPTTSPILADIQYPDGERDDQYFTYREITQTNVLLGKSLNTIMGREVEFNREALDILMKGE